MEFDKQGIVRDYRVGVRSRQVSLLGRREVLTGKAKFGIFGDGKEVPQLAMARAFRNGDFRSGYYRDQTFMFAIGALTVEQFFAQLYADPDPEREPSSAGRQMNSHFATHLLDESGNWLPATDRPNSSADLSPTAGQMPRLVGLAYASRLYRELPELADRTNFSHHGNEIAFGTIGNASTAEGLFWEAINAVGVLRAPLLMSIWDDGYGISVSNEHQVTKGDLSAVLSGFRRQPGEKCGYDLYTVPGWDYPTLCETYLNAAEIVRLEHVPAILHITEVTQPQGHSTSGSHERYKSKERLAWEEEFDCLKRMRQWILESQIASDGDLEALEAEEKSAVLEAQQAAWEAFQAPIRRERDVVVSLLAATSDFDPSGTVARLVADVERSSTLFRRPLFSALREARFALRGHREAPVEELRSWLAAQSLTNERRYSSHLFSESGDSALGVEEVVAEYDSDGPWINGFEVLNACFDSQLAARPELIAFGEDVGKLGDVNQGFAGLQAKYGDLRVSDTGIRESTIMGQAIGLALRGLRPIAEIQYLDYILYGLQILSDDLASLHYRTAGRQKAPVIVRTRGHRLEGVWHSGSPMAGILGLVRGIHVCVPRDMTQAAGFYNTLLASQDPAIVIEVLNGYRIKERLPSNIGDFRVPLGQPEVLREGRDLTVVTYGACCRLALEAAEFLATADIDVEILDVQTLLPFDVDGKIVESLRKTGRVLFLDEDVPGGATAFMLQQTLERGGFWWLDGAPGTLTAKAHRPAYGSDGDYFSKPGRDDIVEAIYRQMRESDTQRFPALR
ncbi:MAG: transketolase [Thermoanaerobaculia bacterium]|nr:transketolase [Thermoanaerobaculia bacterium]